MYHVMLNIPCYAFKEMGTSSEKTFQLVHSAGSAIMSISHTLYLLICRNEYDVGVGIKKSGLPRSEVFVVTKLWVDDHGYDRCKAAFNESLKK
jgi:2,5-diketo-D-gluconate reductase A